MTPDRIAELENLIDTWGDKPLWDFYKEWREMISEIKMLEAWGSKMELASNHWERAFTRDQYKLVDKDKRLQILLAKQDKALHIISDAHAIIAKFSPEMCRRLDEMIDFLQTKSSCTCDDIGEGPCPIHARENALQDEVIALRNKLNKIEKNVCLCDLDDDAGYGTNCRIHT